MTKACICLLAWSVSFKRIFIWLQIPAYLSYKHAAKTGTGCESFLQCKLELKSICSRNRPQHIGHGPNKQKTWFHLSCTRQKPDVNMKERKTTESNDPKKPLLIDTELEWWISGRDTVKIRYGWQSLSTKRSSSCCCGHVMSSFTISLHTTTHHNHKEFLLFPLEHYYIYVQEKQAYIFLFSLDHQTEHRIPHS